VCLLLGVVNCADGNAGSDGGPVDAAGVDARAACGSSNAIPDDRPCCPSAWMSGTMCDPRQNASANGNTCWSQCYPANLADAGERGVRSQLYCGAEGVVISGKGLFPCTPD
jgi:hypothetical protein